jgi:guanosine-3',5'-bis(diphosphate) 3'-pyrophosphohydrolase
MENKAEIGTFIKALSFAAEKHRNQRRKDAKASPYINHPIELADVLANEGNVTDIDTLCAAVLHDTIEDTEATEGELKEIFGERITAIVIDVTDDKSLPYDDRKESQVRHAPNSLPEAKLVKLADKICNLRNILSAPPVEWSEDRKDKYFKWAELVVQGIRGAHPGLERIFDELVRRKNFL